jgi:drug/metabolite transporter (DMT)-like permease
VSAGFRILKDVEAVKPSGNAVFIALMLTAMIIWGGSWTSSKMIANLAQPEVLIFWRFLFAALSFAPILLIFGKPLKISGASFIHILLGSLFLLGYNKFFFWGLQNGFAGAAGVLVTTLNPLFTFLLMLVFFRRKVFPRQVIGLLLGYTGGGILLEIWAVNLSDLFASGNAFFILASLSWAFLTIVSEKSKDDSSPLVFSFYIFCLTAVLSFFVALPYKPLEVLHNGSVFWINILYMSFAASTFATTVFFFASGRLGSEKASAFIFTIPFSAVLISWWILGEIPRLCTIVGGVIAVSAVYLINVTPKVDPHVEVILSGKPESGEAEADTR